MIRSVKRSYRYERGQALIESALFLPLMFLAMFSLIFFCRLGVLSERAESAVRYGDLVSFRDGQAYTVSALSLLLNNVVYNNSSSQLLGLCLAPGAAGTPSPSASGVNADIRAALYENQVPPNASPSVTAPPTAKPFFQPDSFTQPNCSPGTINLNGASPSGGNYKYPVGNLPLSLTTFSITANVNTPDLVGPILTAAGDACTSSTGAKIGGCSSTTADMAFINVAAPTTLIACVPGLSVVLTILNPLAGAPLCQ